MEITLYSTHCPKCAILENKLKEKKIDYTLVTNEEVMLAKGFEDVPKLEVDGNVMGYTDAVRWVRESKR